MTNDKSMSVSVHRLQIHFFRRLIFRWRFFVVVLHRSKLLAGYFNTNALFFFKSFRSIFVIVAVVGFNFYKFFVCMR